MILPFEKLPDDSKVWIYQSSRKFSDIEKNKINTRSRGVPDFFNEMYFSAIF